MSFKNLLKKKLGNHYYKIRSKYILTKILKGIKEEEI